MPATFDKILGKPLLHTHKTSDISDFPVIPTSVSDTTLLVTSNQTLTSSSANILLVDATSGVITIILPAASTMTNKTLTIKKTDSSNNIVVIDGFGNETIDNDSSMTICFYGTTMQIVSNGTSWYII